jgi:uncharacterized protein YozE (UPF0346 family)
MIMQTFQQWLESQRERKDIVGDFAFTILQDDELPTYKKRGDEHQMWAKWLVNHKPSQELINAFNVAWKEYQAAKV